VLSIGDRKTAHVIIIRNIYKMLRPFIILIVASHYKFTRRDFHKFYIPERINGVPAGTEFDDGWTSQRRRNLIRHCGLSLRLDLRYGQWRGFGSLRDDPQRMRAQFQAASQSGISQFTAFGWKVINALNRSQPTRPFTIVKAHGKNENG